MPDTEAAKPAEQKPAAPAPEPKPEAAASDPVPVAAAPAPIEVTLEEFCASVSATRHAVELLSGFHTDRVLAGQRKATTDAFAAELAAFEKRPVG